MAASTRLGRALSVYNLANRRWVPIPLGNPTPCLPSGVIGPALTPRLSLVSWNVNAILPQGVLRTRLILGDIVRRWSRPDVISLQEVTAEVRASILDDARVQAAFLVTDAED
jgi:tyrosyl-DNA phosphodiesterase 2